MSHLRIFGYLMYIHVLEEKRTKKEPSSIKGALEAYKIFIPTLWSIVLSKDVKFKEGLASRKSHETLPVTKDEE